MVGTGTFYHEIKILVVLLKIFTVPWYGVCFTNCDGVFFDNLHEKIIYIFLIYNYFNSQLFFED